MVRQSSIVIAGFAMLAVGMAPTRAATVVVDNVDAGFTILSQVWESASVSGQYGGNYRWRYTAQAAGAVEWRPDLPAASAYVVEVWYRSTGSGRPSDATYTVNHVAGATDVVINQQISGSQWVPLGQFDFNAGTGGSVQLTSAAEPGKVIVADAVRFRGVAGAAEVDELRACWLTHYYYLGKTESQLRAAAQNMRSGGINTVYLAAYSGQATYWPSTAYAAAGGNWAVSGSDLLAYLVEIFRDEGLKVGAWFEYGMAVGFANHPIAQAHPDWLAEDIGGDPVTGENGGFVFLSPGSEPAMNMVRDMVRELAENYAFDDIQIDRFRWGRRDLGQGREYGYEAATADRYFATYGANPPADRNHPTWVAFREDLVNQVVQDCYNIVKAANPNIVVSSAPTGSYGITQHMQRWSDWVEGGYMDVVMPQMYQTSLSSFINELSVQMAQAPQHLDQLAVGYRAQDDNDWTVVRDQLNHARANGIFDGSLWVYHQYTNQVAIQDEIDNLTFPGEPWELSAANPFTSERMVQLVMDDDDGSPIYTETGVWLDSVQPDKLKFGSRVADGGAVRTATFSTEIPKTGRYEAFVWHTASFNRNPAAKVTVLHANGATDLYVDQTTDGGQWISLGTFNFAAGSLAARMVIDNDGVESGTYTSADGAKLVLVGYGLGDATGDNRVDATDYALAEACYQGPAIPASIACEAFDFDLDLDVDLLDFAALQRAYDVAEP
jgi:uncharacterized lipoprotein YddW (UPF0748 family)